MTTTPVRFVPPIPGFDDSALNGLPVLGRDWAAAAGALNFVRGRGGVLVPAYDPMFTVDPAVAATTTATDYHFRVFHREQCFARVWVIGLRRSTAVSASDGLQMAISAPAGGTAVNYAVTESELDACVPIVFIERLSAVVVGEQDITIRIRCVDAAKAPSYELFELACFEMPRANLVVTGGGGADDGVNVDTLRALQTIYDGSAVGASVGGIGGTLGYAEAQSMRPGLMAWNVPDDSARTATGGWADFFEGYPPAYAHPVNAVTKAVLPRVRAKVGAASVGEVRTTTRLGDTDTISISGTSFAYVGSGTLDLDAELMTAADGRRGAPTSETVRWEWRLVSGAGPLSVSGLYLLDG